MTMMMMMIIVRIYIFVDEELYISSCFVKFFYVCIYTHTCYTSNGYRFFSFFFFSYFILLHQFSFCFSWILNTFCEKFYAFTFRFYSFFFTKFFIIFFFEILLREIWYKIRSEFNDENCDCMKNHFSLVWNLVHKCEKWSKYKCKRKEIFVCLLIQMQNRMKT